MIGFVQYPPMTNRIESCTHSRYVALDSAPAAITEPKGRRRSRVDFSSFFYTQLSQTTRLPDIA